MLADVLFGGYPRHHQTGRRGNDQRRNLRHQTVADGQQGVGLGRVPGAHVMLDHADDQAADDIDEQNQNAGDGITAHELGGAIHRAVKVRLQRHGSAAFARLVLADQACIQIGVDGHLLARHGIQREARRYFGDAPGALGDHDEIDQRQDDEHHDADRVVAPHQKVTEGLDHLAGSVRTGVPVKQHDSRRSHVQRQSQQRGDQQNRRENREVERLHGVHRHQQHHDRDGNVEGKEHVEHKRRQWQHHHRQDKDDEQRRQHLTNIQPAEKGLECQAVIHSGDPGSNPAGTSISAGTVGRSMAPALAANSFI